METVPAFGDVTEVSRGSSVVAPSPSASVVTRPPATTSSDTASPSTLAGRKINSPIIEDLETINALGEALNQQLEKFHKKYNMFPDAQLAADKYTNYLLSSQTIYHEARRDVLNKILSEKNIPHMIKSYHDPALNGIFQAQKGWGRLDAPAEFKEEIESIYNDLFT